MPPRISTQEGSCLLCNGETSNFASAPGLTPLSRTTQRLPHDEDRRPGERHLPCNKTNSVTLPGRPERHRHRGAELRYSLLLENSEEAKSPHHSLAWLPEGKADLKLRELAELFVNDLPLILWFCKSFPDERSPG